MKCGMVMMVLLAGVSNVMAAPQARKAQQGSSKVESAAPRAEGFYALTATSLDGAPVPLSKYSGKVTLVVNTASRCGLTPQYEGLQKLQAKYEARGFTVLGFPSNDFFGQEPGTNQEIKIFCEKNYQVSFPLFSKDHVKGDAKQALYRYLTEGPQQEFRGEVSWNFEKFLIGRDGRIVARFSPRISPDDVQLISKLEGALAAK